MTETLKRAITLALCLIVLSCTSSDKTIDLGFIGGLTGGNADLGEAARNGAIMAVEEVNEAGGINGIPVKIIIKDDNNRAEKAREVAQELIDLHVQAIIGPLTSTTTAAAIEVTNPAGIVVASPTASAIHLAEIDDHLIRFCPTSKDNAYSYAEFIYQTLGHRTLSVVADAQNRVYSDSWYGDFSTRWKELGGEILMLEFFNTKNQTEYNALAERLLFAQPDGILFIANSVDVARYSQQFRKLNADIPLIAAEWAATQNLITLGGMAVEGLISMQIVNFFDTSPKFVRFVESYQERFGTYPSFSSIISYDAATAVMKALEMKGKQTLKQSLLVNQPYDGLQKPLAIDDWGDLIGQSTFVIVRDNEYRLFER
ncbi:ABC transporter substrate-binding protein [Reinekea marinisedimentorum]|uniref:Branched-chain amino acid transport system substrate-binding protein n=1 Tax=Reinekea marinisedimentorum TaxID=230495 RepID=A0A4R3IAZ5_9GAMM|nr:ABC transporter substrate-binding protein [Reinekea marinisedimentorum]TCS42707.1 branched-chain amino acid transport system substrate-binding protein [Reinekea marinisedimentorum]